MFREENKNLLTISIMIILIIILAGILIFKIANDRKDDRVLSNNSKTEIQNNGNLENKQIDEQNENNVLELQNIMEDEHNYVMDKTQEADKQLSKESEKETIQTAVGMIMFGSDTLQGLTYDNLNEQLKSDLGEGNYTLEGPNSNGQFTIKIEDRVYTVDKNGSVK